MSILGTSPTSTRHFDMNIAEALGDINAAVILQQLDYWLKKEGVGVVVEGNKYIYNTFQDWVSQQFSFLSEWRFRKAMNILRSLSIVEVIRYRAKEWNQTNHYRLNYERLKEWAKAKNIEIFEMCATTSQGEGYQTLEIESSSTSLNESKNTTKKETTKQDYGDRSSNKLNPIAAAPLKRALEEEKSEKDSNSQSARLEAFPSQKKQEFDSRQSNLAKEKSSGEIDYIVNKNWKSLISILDDAGIPINKTLRDLLKLYPSEKVEGAIALIKARKRDQHIPNPSGYFMAALKGDWGNQSLVSQQGDRSEEIDKGAVFRHWYDLARELGYCSGQEVREGEQWVYLSGAWEKWLNVVNRGYSLDYLKKVMKRNS